MPPKQPHRISAACNSCRSRKQKCSGPRSQSIPVLNDLQNHEVEDLTGSCEQCQANDVECVWPQQKKRGPAKGYIEGLERRVLETEALLLQLLPGVSEEDLVRATEVVRDVVSGTDRRTGDIVKPSTVNMKDGLEYWDEFGLTSAEGVRRWYKNCEVQSQVAGGPKSRSNGNLGGRKRQKRGSIATTAKDGTDAEILQDNGPVNANLFEQPRKSGLLSLSMAAESLMPIHNTAEGLVKGESHLFW